MLLFVNKVHRANELFYGRAHDVPFACHLKMYISCQVLLLDFGSVLLCVLVVGGSWLALKL